MKINYNGQEIEAYSLIMTKENALDILNGKKTIETRMLSAKYEKMFTDFAQVDENEKFRKAGREQECQPILRTDIEAIHFYSNLLFNKFFSLKANNTIMFKNKRVKCL